MNSGHQTKFSTSSDPLPIARVKLKKKKKQEKRYQLFWFEISLPQASKKEETYFATIKILQKFKGYCHCHCTHIFTFLHYKLLTIFQSKWSKVLSQVRWYIYIDIHYIYALYICIYIYMYTLYIHFVCIYIYIYI